MVFACEFCEISKSTDCVKHLRTAASVYYQANINVKKSLLARDLLIIHLTQLCQKYKNKRNAFDRLRIRIQNKIRYNF